jgi:hypothetical protein
MRAGEKQRPTAGSGQLTLLRCRARRQCAGSRWSGTLRHLPLLLGGGRPAPMGSPHSQGPANTMHRFNGPRTGFSKKRAHICTLTHISRVGGHPWQRRRRLVNETNKAIWGKDNPIQHCFATN